MKLKKTLLSAAPWVITPWVILGVNLGVNEEAIAQVTGNLPDIPIPPAAEAMPATSLVSAERARSFASPVDIYQGRSSVIDFSATGEIITYIQLSDLTEIVYDTNAPISTGAARTIVVRLINPIYIEGTTRAVVPNMVVSTIDAQGNTYTYLFDLYQNLQDGRPSQNEGSGIAIAPTEEVRETRLFNTVEIQPNMIRTSAGIATLTDIERGLAYAIEQEYTAPDDPVVFAVEEAIAQARNGTPLRTAASELGIDMAVLTSLGEMGIGAEVLEAFEEPEATDSGELVVPVQILNGIEVPDSESGEIDESSGVNIELQPPTLQLPDDIDITPSLQLEL